MKLAVRPRQFFYVLLGVLGLIVVVAGGGYYLAMKKLHSEVQVLSDQLAKQIAAVEQTEDLSRLKRQYDREIVPILPLLEDALPRDKKQTEILAQLQAIAASVGLQIGSVTMPSPVGAPTPVSQTVKAGAVLALPISFQLSGSYAQLQTFTARVENLNRFTNITNLAISRPDKTKPIVYSMSLNAYIKP